jgi:type IV pilus assembly protein PilY1
MLALYRDGAARPRSSLGLDGTLRVLRLDRNGNGIIEPAPDGSGDRVVLYFGMRRGGRHYYAVDVTQVDFRDPAGDRPSLLWIAGPPETSAIPADRQLPLVGQTWSRPLVTRLAVPEHSGTDDLVVVFAGGYDPGTQDPPDGQPQPYLDDAIGTGIYVLDAFTGRRLWRAGPDAQADLVLPGMTSAFPGDAAVLDLTGDGYADVVYAGDLKGQVWRLDFARGAPSLDRLASGGVLASLGAAGVSGARRFFASPDVSWVVHGGRSWLNVAIGSGNRELPLSDTRTADRFYSLRDYHGNRSRDWSSHVPIAESDLVDVTPADSSDATQAAVPPDAAGWLLRLDTAPGEKSISPSRTIDYTVFFPTFVPDTREPDANDGACPAPAGYNLLYQVGVVDARPGRRLQDSPHPPAARGLAIRLAQPGIAPPPAFVFPGRGSDPPGPAARPEPLCLVGTESCGRLDASEPRRTSWRERGAE